MAFGLFKKKEKKEAVDNRYLEVIVKDVVEVAKDAVNVIFDVQGQDFSYQPGQFLTIIDEVNGKKIRRAYSLCSTPGIDQDPAVTIKRVPGGLMSNHINDHYSAGRVVQVMEPMGMFTTDYEPDAQREIVMVGGGSGITPLFSILRKVLQDQPHANVKLVYGNRSEEFVIFKSALDDLQKQHSNFKVYHILESDSAEKAFLVGRPDEALVAQLMTDLSVTATTEIFLCGPQPMMDVFQAGMNKAGIGADQIKLESFVAGKTSPAEKGKSAKDAASNDAEVTITLNDEEYVLTLDKSKAILEQALEKELDMPYSCQSGLCTACRGKCVEGEVSVDEAMGLSADEIAQGYVLTCVGKALSDRVKVEMG
ncbi:MAG: ring-1,2-phenylacetyl-CoA epoxidase subunit PaaE [Cyclobacteriaceae bacterium]|jgi:ring-1,2-phenylacetyl-CoA epoxidase subunit PaaE